MKFGIIGAGVIGEFHAQAIKAMDGGELVGAADLNAERAAALAGQHGCRGYETVAEMLADPEIEIVTVSTPSGVHFDPAMAALNAGKHVAVEKPLEINTERIDTMMAAAADNRVCLAAILNRRFHRALEIFKQAVDAGRLGKMTSASAYIKWYRTQAYYDSAGWRGTWALDGGGAVMNQSIHTIDALQYLAGPVKTVQAHAACMAHENIEVEDHAVAMLEFSNGAMGVIEASTCTWSEAGHPARIQLGGTEGSVFLADEAFEIWDFKHPQPEDSEIRASLMTGATAGLGANDPLAINFSQHQRNFEEIVTAIQEGREPATSAAEARKGVAIINAIYQSAQNGGAKVTLD